MKHIEDLTLRELSERVGDDNGKAKAREEAEFNQLVKATAGVIAQIIQATVTRTPQHEFAPYGSDHLPGCVKCPFGKDHYVHAVMK